jgi:hypothetical protein
MDPAQKKALVVCFRELKRRKVRFLSVRILVAAICVYENRSMMQKNPGGEGLTLAIQLVNAPDRNLFVGLKDRLKALRNKS